MAQKKNKRTLNPAQMFMRSERLREKKRNRMEKKRKRLEGSSTQDMVETSNDGRKAVYSQHQGTLSVKKTQALQGPLRNADTSLGPIGIFTTRPAVVTEKDRMILPSVTEVPQNDNTSNSSSTYDSDSEATLDTSSTSSSSCSTEKKNKVQEDSKSNVSVLASVRQRLLSRLNAVAAQKLKNPHSELSQTCLSTTPLVHQNNASKGCGVHDEENEDLDPIVASRLTALLRNSSVSCQQIDRNTTPVSTNVLNPGLVNVIPPMIPVNSLNPLQPLGFPTLSNAVPWRNADVQTCVMPPQVQRPDARPIPPSESSNAHHPHLTQSPSQAVVHPQPCGALLPNDPMNVYQFRIQNKSKVSQHTAQPRSLRWSNRASLAESAKSVNRSMVSSSIRTPLSTTPSTAENIQDLDKAFRNFMDAVSKSLE